MVSSATTGASVVVSSAATGSSTSATGSSTTGAVASSPSSTAVVPSVASVTSVTSISIAGTSTSSLPPARTGMRMAQTTATQTAMKAHFLLPVQQFFSKQPISAAHSDFL